MNSYDPIADYGDAIRGFRAWMESQSLTAAEKRWREGAFTLGYQSGYRTATKHVDAMLERAGLSCDGGAT